MKEKPSQATIGVIVGRFQIPKLHEGHLDLVKTVAERHPKTVIVLGLAPTLVTRNNPLDFESRKQMLLEAFPEATVLYIKDVPSDPDWSARLDEILKDTYPTGSFVLYGGRDSFLKRYTGKFPAVELLQERFFSGTDARNDTAKKHKASADFRAGVVYAAFNQYPKCFATVDVAILDGPRILLARKPHEKLYRFVGGFSDPVSASFEADARREVQEETGLEIGDLQYLGSTIIDDWRYRSEVDKIKTLFFRAKYVFGRPQATDDIAEVRWFEISRLTADEMVPEHRPLLAMLAASLQT